MKYASFFLTLFLLLSSAWGGARTDFYVWPRWSLDGTGNTNGDLFKWTVSLDGTDEYYLEAAAGGQSALVVDPPMVEENGSDMTQGTVSALTAGQFDWGDAVSDALGYDTLYVRLTATGDPDAQVDEWVQAGGDDAAAGTSEVVAFETTQGGLDNATDGTDGSHFNMKSGAVDVLAAGLSFVTFGVPAAAAPWVIEGYTTTARDNGRGELDGNAIVAIINAPAQDNTSFVNMKMGNTGSVLLLWLDNDCNFSSCEIYGSSNANPVVTGFAGIYDDCYFHTFTGTHLVRGESYTSFFNCYIDGGTQSGEIVNVSSNTINTLIGTIIKCNHVDANGIFNTNSYLRVENCSIYNEAVGTEAGINSSNMVGAAYRNNIIEGWSGTGGAPIKTGAANSNLVIRGNVYFGNTTNAAVHATDIPTVERNNTVASASLFTDPSSGDFTITTEAQDVAYPQVFRGAALSTTFQDAGAADAGESGGGAAVSVVGHVGG